MKEEVDFNIFKAQILEEIKAGKPLFGKDGALAPMIENIVNAVLEGEMDAHLTRESRESGNRRNGKMQKQVQTPVGDITVTTPRDRDASFDPQFIKKRETMLSEGMADRIIGLYALGTSTRDISNWLEETVGTSISAETISSITDRVLPELEAWRNRSLDEVYPIVWLDALHYKVMDEKNRVVSRAIYNVLGIDKDGHKDLLGMYVSKSEGANFWLSVLTDLQNRGVKDIMIACIDGLKGFPDAIKSVFPDTAVQLCVIHQIRNSMKYVGSKYQKEFMKDLKPVYGAVTKDAGEMALDKLEEKWGEQYPIVIKSWRDNWDRLSEYFQYSEPIRKLIYTTNTVEGYHRQIRKVTKNKGVFPNDTALVKLVYLAYRNARRKWTMPVPNWGIISQQLAIKFEDRYIICCRFVIFTPINRNLVMKKFIISISLILLLFVAFFLMLILTKTPMNLSLIGSGVATLIAGSYLGLSIMGKPFRAISTNIDKLTDIKRVGYFVGLLSVNMCVCWTLLETKDATMETLPLTFYCIAFVIAVFVGFFTRKLFISLETNNAK